MDFAVNYSDAAAALVDAGVIAVDRFKCPAWPDLLARVVGRYPLYVHFPLRVGWGRGDALNTETGEAADWDMVDAILAQTGTPLVNVHLEPTARDFPDIPHHSTDPRHIETIAEALIRDVRAIVARYGAARVIAENVPNGEGLRPAYLPAVVRRVVDETGCGLLFDLSHARRSARGIGMDAGQYIAALPVAGTREMHITGIQTFGEHWVGVLRDAGLDDARIAHFAGRWQDHLPFTDADWAFTSWAMAQLHSGAWGAPWVVSLEYGGLGQLWGAFTDEAVLRAQVPRLRDLVQSPAC